MNTSLRKLVAAVSSLAIAATLPIASLAVSAEDAAPTISIVADKTTVKAGDTVTLTVKTENLPAEGWNAIQMSVDYDDALVPDRKSVV